jgi:anti-sigma-K factor RskA
MTPADEDGPDRGSEDMLAAEYVVGALAAEERRAAAERIERDPVFARLVDQWEVRLSPLASAYADAEPPASAKAAIDRRLFEGAGVASGRPRFWSNINFWRALAAAAILSHALSVAVPYFLPSGEAPPAQLVASLAADGSDVRYLALYDPQRHQVGLSHVSGERGAGKDFELWMIEGDKAPVSMGVIPAGASVHVGVDEQTQARLEKGAVLAVSLEPSGGSPTGQPTGPVVAAGDLKDI